MNRKKIFDFIAEKNPKYDLKSYIGSNPRLIQFMNEPTEEHKKHLLRNHPELYYTIENPSVELQLFAIKNSVYPINDFTRRNAIDDLNVGLQISKWFNLDSYYVRLAFVRKDPKMIVFIDNPEEGLNLEAVIIKPEIIKYISNPTEEVQMISVQKDGQLIKHIENPTERVQLYIIEETPEFFYLINNPSNNVKKFYRQKLNDELEHLKDTQTRLPSNTVVQSKIDYISKELEKIGNLGY